MPFDTSDITGDNAKAKDAFNFYLSSFRIYIECAFGELVMRWGIFWRTLLFDLRKSSDIITVAMLLHNFIIENRRDGVTDGAYFENFKMNNDDSLQAAITRKTGEMPRALVSDNNEPKTPGRLSDEEIAAINKGERVRNRLTVNLATAGMERPMHNTMKYNSEGHIYMTY